jgi:hypothetical protein
MNPMIPANNMPLELRTVVNGMFPIEPIKVSAATKGATAAFSSAMSHAGKVGSECARKIIDQNEAGTSTATKPATVKPIRISSQTMAQLLFGNESLVPSVLLDLRLHGSIFPPIPSYSW